jgi:glycerol kinase
VQTLLSIDQGTTSSRTVVFSPEGELLYLAQQEFPQIYPADGWVEHDPESIWETTLATLKDCVAWCELQGHAPVGIGITNQRETTLVWNRETGKCLYNAIVWQDRRTAERCRELAGHEGEVRAKTGLLMDPYFSAAKMAWILDHVEGARAQAEAGELAFGTVDSYLIWRLTEGQVHATDATNASRTNLFNIHSQAWDAELCDLFGVPQEGLPDVRDCAANYGMASVLETPLPILGVAGDQQAALIGQTGFARGDLKSTYGTGAFLILNTGDEVMDSSARLLSTVAYRLDGKVTYGLEGAIFIAGAAVQWLRDGVEMIADSAETEKLMAEASEDSQLILVPAFTGLGAPHWDPEARGAVFGITRATGRAEFARATVESVAYQTADLFKAMAADGREPEGLFVDGGMSANNLFLQFLSDILGVEVARPDVLETTALGVAYLVGLQAGLYESLDAIPHKIERRFTPDMEADERETRLAAWSKAVEKVLN